MLQEHQEGASPHEPDHLISHVRTEGVGELGGRSPEGRKHWVREGVGLGHQTR